jgi:hypothetical protein
MEDMVQKFIALCDQLIQETFTQQAIWEQHGSSANVRVRAVDVLRRHVEQFRAKAVDGSLWQPGIQMGGGFGRAVGEWAHGTRLYELAYDLENLYEEIRR